MSPERLWMSAPYSRLFFVEIIRSKKARGGGIAGALSNAPRGFPFFPLTFPAVSVLRREKKEEKDKTKKT